MRRFVFVGLAAALFAAALPAQASSITLAQRVSRLEAKMNCLARVPVTQFVDYTWFGLNDVPDLSNVDPSDPNTYPTEPLVNWGPTTGLDLAYAPYRPQAWIAAVKNTAACRSKFRVLANPSPARVSTRVAMMRLARIR